jgi:hypothetical protein
VNWELIGSIESSGNWSSQNIYNFVDNNPGRGLVYYRVRELDPDGLAKLSSVRSVRLDGSMVEEKLYPNPARGSVQLTHRRVETSARLVVYNLLGQVVQSQFLPKASVSQTIDIAQWPNGVYSLQVTHEDGVVSHYRLVKY